MCLKSQLSRVLTTNPREPITKSGPVVEKSVAVVRSKSTPVTSFRRRRSQSAVGLSN